MGFKKSSWIFNKTKTKSNSFFLGFRKTNFVWYISFYINQGSQATACLCKCFSDVNVTATIYSSKPLITLACLIYINFILFAGLGFRPMPDIQTTLIRVSHDVKELESYVKSINTIIHSKHWIHTVLQVVWSFCFVLLVES